MTEEQLWERWQAAIDRRDSEAKAAYQRQWQRYQHKVEAARAAYMAGRAGKVD